MKITVTNSAPVFLDTPIPTVNIYQGETKSQIIRVSDAEGHTPIFTVSPVLNFIKFDNKDTFSISPTESTPTGQIAISISASDGII
jgi:hypothetical protein